MWGGGAALEIPYFSANDPNQFYVYLQVTSLFSKQKQAHPVYTDVVSCLSLTPPCYHTGPGCPPRPGAEPPSHFSGRPGLGLQIPVFSGLLIFEIVSHSSQS